jgi:hypothetical protein
MTEQNTTPDEAGEVVEETTDPAQAAKDRRAERYGDNNDDQAEATAGDTQTDDQDDAQPDTDNGDNPETVSTPS